MQWCSCKLAQKTILIEKLPQAAVDVRQGLEMMVSCLLRVCAAAPKHCFVLQAQQEEMWLEFFLFFIFF